MSSAIEQLVFEDVWHGLYGESWKAMIHDEAFAHPAKFSRALIRRIYDHVIAEGWASKGDSVVDPFGGVALGGLDAMRHGLNWYGCELEEKFVGLGNQNIALWNDRFSRMPNWGTARLIQGDSRKLAEVLSTTGCCVSSPPYAGKGNEGKTADRDRRRLERLRPDLVGRFDTCFRGGDYDYGENTEGQLGAMKEGDLNLAISSKRNERSEITGFVYFMLWQSNNPKAALLEVGVPESVLLFLSGKGVPVVSVTFNHEVVSRDEEVAEVPPDPMLTNVLNLFGVEQQGERRFEITFPVEPITQERAVDAATVCNAMRLNGERLTAESALSLDFLPLELGGASVGAELPTATLSNRRSGGNDVSTNKAVGDDAAGISEAPAAYRAIPMCASRLANGDHHSTVRTGDVHRFATPQESSATGGAALVEAFSNLIGLGPKDDPANGTSTVRGMKNARFVPAPLELRVTGSGAEVIDHRAASLLSDNTPALRASHGPILSNSNVALGISSPPYNPPMSLKTIMDHEAVNVARRQAKRAHSSNTAPVRASDAQSAPRRRESAELAITSPPYERSMDTTEHADKRKQRANGFTQGMRDTKYGQNPNTFLSKDPSGLNNQQRHEIAAKNPQVGALDAETFWSASRLILEQLHQVIVPGGHAVFVVKAFVRDKKIVDFPGQWAQLCEAVGFRLLHHHRASLVEHSGTQGGFHEDKEIRVERKSFFRRLAESKGSPRIDHESVLCFERA